MFHLLLESGAPQTRRTGWTFASAGAHVAFIALATILTLRELAPRTAREPLEGLIFTTPPPAAPTPPSRKQTSSGALALVAPLEIPIAIPQVPDVRFPTETRLRLDPSEALGAGLLSRGVPAVDSSNRLYAEHLVERAVLPRRDNPHPPYPPALRSSQVQGDVLVQFVVDTTGRVEPQTIAILRTTHPLFGESVQRWLPRTRYSPAEVDGRPVRQLVQQEIGFTLRP